MNQVYPDEIDEPRLTWLIQEFIHEQCHPGSSAHNIPNLPPFYKRITIHTSAITTFHAPSNLSGIGGMKCEHIHAVKCWRNGPGHYDMMLINAAHNNNDNDSSSVQDDEGGGGQRWQRGGGEVEGDKGEEEAEDDKNKEEEEEANNNDDELYHAEAFTALTCIGGKICLTEVSHLSLEDGIDAELSEFFFKLYNTFSFLSSGGHPESTLPTP